MSHLDIYVIVTLSGALFFSNIVWYAFYTAYRAEVKRLNKEES